MIPNLSVLGSLIQDIQTSLSQLFYIMLPVAIILSIVIGYLKSGDPKYPDILKRALVASLMLATFPEVSNLILDVTDGIAAKIDGMSGLDTFIRMAGEKAGTYSQSKSLIFLKFNDLIISALTFGSFILVWLARYITIALYYFYWVLLCVLSPLMILAYLFPATAGITKNLYQGLIEVASWKILWAIMSAMLTSLSYGNIYHTQGSYPTLIMMNFIIAFSLLRTSSVMKSLIGGGVQGMAGSTGAAAAVALISVPMKVVTAARILKISSAIKNSNDQIRRYL